MSFSWSGRSSRLSLAAISLAFGATGCASLLGLDVGLAAVALHLGRIGVRVIGGHRGVPRRARVGRLALAVVLVCATLAGVVAGMIAAVLPAIRATRLPVLEAIAYE